jgi:hypothetical protein
VDIPDQQPVAVHQVAVIYLIAMQLEVEELAAMHKVAMQWVEMHKVAVQLEAVLILHLAVQ